MKKREIYHVANLIASIYVPHEEITFQDTFCINKLLE